MAIKSVIFDLDGTLAYFTIDYMTARAEIVRFLRRQGIPKSLLSLRTGVFETLKRVKRHMKDRSKEERRFEEIRKEVISIIERYESEAAHKTNLLPNVLEMLKTLRNMKLKMAIFTTNSEKSTSYILNRFEIARFFEAVITRESVSALKPDPVHLEAALRALGVNSEEAMVVGDSTRDMECARKINVIAVGLTTGISSPESLISAGADYLASSAADIPGLVQQLNEHS